MCKKIILLVLFSMSTIITGCTATSGGGGDMASIRSNRGSESAQITHAEAEQYERQQRIVSRELDLERKKQRNTTDAVSDVTSAAWDVTSLIRRF